MRKPVRAAVPVAPPEPAPPETPAGGAPEAGGVSGGGAGFRRDSRPSLCFGALFTGRSASVAVPAAGLIPLAPGAACDPAGLDDGAAVRNGGTSTSTCMGGCIVGTVAKLDGDDAETIAAISAGVRCTRVSSSVNRSKDVGWDVKSGVTRTDISASDSDIATSTELGSDAATTSPGLSTPLVVPG
jgi:hypothetical protein